MCALAPDIKSALETRLLIERDRLISKHPALKMFPKSVVCPLGVIKEVCGRSRAIANIEDMHSLPCIRPEFHEPFLKLL